MTYAAARAAAADALHPGTGGLLRTPNNILGIEYCKAILHRNAALTPLALPRLGAAHGGGAGAHAGTPMASASFLRGLPQPDWEPFVPARAAELYGRAAADGLLLDGARLETAVLALLRMQDPANFAQVRGVSEGLENRLTAAVREADSLDDLYTRLKTKRYPHARLRRLVLDAALGFPEFRLPKTVLDDFEYRHLRLKGIKVRPNTDVGKALKIEDLFRDGYKAIFIGTGVWRPNTLHIKGESLGNVHYAINYLQNPDVYHLGNRVIVIGAGNAAMDVARTAIRHGTRHLECFSLSSHITASEYEASYAKLEGVNFIFNKKPLEITDKGVVFIDLNEAEDGTLTEIPGTEKLYPADSVIVSISQGPCTTITDSTKNLKTTPRGLFETDEVGRTSIPGIFASGDAVKGARTVVEAVAYSKNVAEAMHEYMQTLPPDLPDEYANVPVAEYDEGN